MTPFKSHPLFVLVLGLLLIPISGFGEKNTELAVTDTMRTETRYIVNAMEKIHYNKLSLKSLNFSSLLDKFFSDLDLSRLFLRKPQIEEFHKRFDSSMELYLKQGNIYPAFEIFKAYRTDALDRLAWVMTRLDEDFDFSDDSTYAPDRKKEDWPVSIQEANDIWERRLKYELINEMLALEDKESSSKNKTPDANTEAQEEGSKLSKLDEAKDAVRKRYERLKQTIDEIDSGDVEEIFLTTFANMYDPHSTFFSSGSLEDFSMLLHPSIVGIGATLYMENDVCTIKELLVGGPAEKSTMLMPKDAILAVGQGEEGDMVDIVGYKLRDAVDLIRGKEGTIVRLLVRPAGEDPSARKTVTLVREEIKIASSLAQAKFYEIPGCEGKEPVKLGYIDVPAFYGSGGSDDENESTTTNDVEELIDKLKKMGMQGLILDLRRNGGGLLTEAISLAGLFIPVGPVVQVKDSRGLVREYLDNDPKIIWDGPLMLLVTKYSASASEIVAGALKTYNRALIVGDTSTHGKGTVQVVLNVNRPFLSNLWHKNEKLGAAKLTIQKWYLPDGRSTQLKGVPSDIVIPSINEYLPISESDLENPLPWDQIKSIPWAHKSLDDYTDSVYARDIDYLRAKSEERMKTLPEFNYLKKNIKRFREKKEQEIFSLNYKKRLEERREDNFFTKAMEVKLKELAHLNFPSQDVLLDVASSPDKVTFDLNKKEEGEEEDDTPQFDIYTREGLRILADYILYEKEDKPQGTIIRVGKLEPSKD